MLSKRLLLTVLLLAVPHAHGMLSSFSTAMVGSSAQCASMHSMIWPFAKLFGKKITPTAIVNSQTYRIAYCKGLLTEDSQLKLANCRDAESCQEVLINEINRLIPTSHVAQDTLPLDEAQKKQLHDFVARTLAKTIVTEATNPGYHSFFQGTSGQTAALLALQKKLYAQYENKGKEPNGFEFLRPKMGWKQEPKAISGIKDSFERYLEVLPAEYDALYEPFSLHYEDSYLKRTCQSAATFKSDLKQILDAYRLPTPSYDFPKIKGSVLLHIMLSTRNCSNLGVEARFNSPIILLPSVFDRPNTGVKIYTHGLNQDEKQKIDGFCDKLIADAQKLKDGLI